MVYKQDVKQVIITTVPLESNNLEQESPSEVRTCSARRWLKHLFRDTWDDFRSVRWRRGFFWTPFALWCSALVVVLAVLNSLYVENINGADDGCQPDGVFSLHYDEYTAWDFSNIFQVNLAFGRLSFTQVKVIDTLWDLIFGRLGQLFIIVVSWRIFAYYVTFAMAIAPISYRTFWIVFIQKDSSPFSAYDLLREFVVNRSLRSKTAIAFMCGCTIFLIAFPTLASAMTGYTPNVKSFVSDRNSTNLISLSEFRRVAYVIHDGWRVNLTGDYLVEVPRIYDLAFSHVEEVPNSRCYFSHLPGPLTLLQGGPDCERLGNVSTYVQEYGFCGAYKGESTFMNVTIPSPGLNISSFFIGGQEVLAKNNVTNLQDPRYCGNNQLSFTTLASNDTYPFDEMKSNGRCQTMDTYKWGFSFIQLNAMIILLMLWTTGCYLMWLKAFLTMRPYGISQISGDYQSVLKLAGEMRSQLVQGDEKLELLPNQEIYERIRMRHDGGRVSSSLSGFGPTQMYSFRTGMWKWLKKEKYWVIAHAVLLTGILLSGYSPNRFGGLITCIEFAFLFSFLIFGMMIGRRTTLRLLVTIFGGLLGFAIFFPFVVPI